MKMTPISNHKILCKLVMLCLLAEPCLASPQKENTIQRVKFAKGEHSAIVSGELKPSANHIYKLSASKGQRMTVSVQPSSDDVVFWVQSRKLMTGRQTYILEGIGRGGTTDWAGELQFTGAYEIHVANPPINDHPVERATAYILKIEIR